MAIELISTVKPINNGEFPIAEANDIKGGYYSVSSILNRDCIPMVRRTPGMLCYVIGDMIYKLSDDLTEWKPFTVSGGGSGGSNGVFIGPEPPPDDLEGITFWIDTSDTTIQESFTDALISEFNNILTNLTSRIVSLESEVAYLKAVINNGGGTVDPDEPTTPTYDTVMTFEDGALLTFEDGAIACFDTDGYTPTTSDTVITDEQGNVLTFEDGAILCFDIRQEATTNDVQLTFENGDVQTFEDSAIMIF